MNPKNADPNQTKPVNQPLQLNLIPDKFQEQSDVFPNHTGDKSRICEAGNCTSVCTQAPPIKARTIAAISCVKSGAPNKNTRHGRIGEKKNAGHTCHCIRNRRTRQSDLSGDGNCGQTPRLSNLFRCPRRSYLEVPVDAGYRIYAFPVKRLDFCSFYNTYSYSRVFFLPSCS